MNRTTRRGFLGAGLGAGASLLGACKAPGASAQPAPPASSLPAESEPEVTASEQPGRTPNTRFAVNVEMWWTRLPFLERLEQAAALGFPAVEFWPWRGKDLDAIGARCRDLGLEVAQFTAWGFTPGMNDPANHAAVEQEIRASCAVARRLGCEKMTVVAGNDRPGVSKVELLAHVTTALKRVRSIAEGEGVMLILEPMNGRVDHPGHCLYGSSDALRICREVDSTHVKINWDLYHMQIEEGDLCGRLREGFDQVGYVQLADHPGRREPGTGEIHYPRVLRQVHELGYRGFVGLECRPTEELAAARAVARADDWTS